MARHDKTTYIACRPGLQSTLRSTFGEGMVIEVDSTVEAATGYEFRSREDLASQYDLLEEEVRKETLQSADPKNAHTIIVPLDDDYTGASLSYVVVRFQNNRNVGEAVKVLKKVKPVLDEDGDVDDALTLGAVVDALSDADFNVLSASIAEGLLSLNY